MPRPAYMTIEGENQGEIKGSCDLKGREDTILVQKVEHEVHIPSDPQTGLAKGTRVHGPLTIVMEVDKAMPLLYQALCTGEHLTSVELKWFRIAKDGKEEHYFTTKLEDAIIVKIRSWMPDCLDKASGPYSYMADVHFTYRKAIWRHEVDTTEAQDDWKEPSQ